MKVMVVLIEDKDWSLRCVCLDFRVELMVLRDESESVYSKYLTSTGN